LFTKVVNVSYTNVGAVANLGQSNKGHSVASNFNRMHVYSCVISETKLGLAIIYKISSKNKRNPVQFNQKIFVKKQKKFSSA
jgi:hypothetical protein